MDPSVDVSSKQINIPELAVLAQQNKIFLENLLQNLTDPDDIIRKNSFEILHVLSEQHPDILYPYWHHIEKLIHSTNHYHKLIGIRLISNLTKSDVQNKIDPLVDTFYHIICSKKTMTAAHATEALGVVAKNKPHLTNHITQQLLQIHTIHQGAHKELIKSHAITAFDTFYEQSTQQPQILDFVKHQLHSASPKTRKYAADFLKKWEK